MKKEKVLILAALPQELGQEFKEWESQIVFTGIGKVNAALKSASAIHLYKPEVIFNLGTAGTFKFFEREIIEVTEYIQRDMDLSAIGSPLGKTAFDNFGSNLIFKPKTKFKTGSCGSGDCIVQKPEDLKVNCDLFDMEVYSIAKACVIHQIPLITLKFISDSGSMNSWKQNMALAPKELWKAFEQAFSNIK